MINQSFPVAESYPEGLIKVSLNICIHVLGTNIVIYCRYDQDGFTKSLPVVKVTNVRTISEAMLQSEIYKGMLSEIKRVLKLYFTFPVTSATAERSFSSLQKIQNLFEKFSDSVKT